MTEHRSFQLTGIATAYSHAFKVRLTIQAFLFLLTASTLDGGRAHGYCLSAIGGQWVGITICLLRRPKSPTKVDLRLIKYGLLPCLVATNFLAPIVWQQIGRSTENGFERLFGSPSPDDLLDGVGALAALCWLLGVMVSSIWSSLTPTRVAQQSNNPAALLP